MTHSSSGAPPRLLDQVREIIRIRHYSIRTEQAYVHWIRRFILFHDKRHPRDMGAPELTAFLSDLAIKRNVAASTQNQALNALLFLYRDVLGAILSKAMAAYICRIRYPRSTPTPTGNGSGNMSFPRNGVRSIRAAVSSAGSTHRRMHYNLPSSRPCIVRISQSPQQCTRCAIRLRRIFSNQAMTSARFKNCSDTRT